MTPLAVRTSRPQAWRAFFLAVLASSAVLTVIFVFRGDPGRHAAAGSSGVPRFDYRDADQEFVGDLEATLRACALESPKFDILMGPMRKSRSPLAVTPDTSVALSLPYDAHHRPLLRLDLREFDIFPDAAQIDSALNASEGPGYIFPHTPRCAALAHAIFEAIVYRRDYARAPATTRQAAERLRTDANWATVFVENEVAFDYGHRVEPGGYRVDRDGHCRPEEGEIHIIIERHTEIIHYKGSKAEKLGARYNTGRGACLNAVTGEPIESWVDEKGRARLPGQQ